MKRHCESRVVNTWGVSLGLIVVALWSLCLASFANVVTYDDLGRVSTVDYGNGNIINYTYGPMGNRLTETITGTAQPNTTPLLSVSPVSDNLPFAESSPTLAVTNGGGGILTWTTTVTVGAPWLSVTGGGSGSVGGTVTLLAAANPDTSARTGIVRIEALGAINGVIDVVLQQAGSNNVSDTPDGMLVERFHVHQNAPNPFNPVTSIAFELPELQSVRLDVYDLSGRLVNRLIHDVPLGQGRHTATWNGRDGHGRTVAAGVYFYRLKAGEYLETKRMTLVK